MKESIKNIKSSDKVSENRRNIRENSANVRNRCKKYISFVYVRMIENTKETWKRNNVEVIVFKDKKWLREKHIEEQFGHAIYQCYITMSFKI